MLQSHQWCWKIWKNWK